MMHPCVMPETTSPPTETPSSPLGEPDRLETYLLLPLEPKNERKLQAEVTQFTNSFKTRLNKRVVPRPDVGYPGQILRYCRNLSKYR